MLKLNYKLCWQRSGFITLNSLQRTIASWLRALRCCIWIITKFQRFQCSVVWMIFFIRFHFCCLFLFLSSALLTHSYVLRIYDRFTALSTHDSSWAENVSAFFISKFFGFHISAGSNNHQPFVKTKAKMPKCIFYHLSPLSRKPKSHTHTHRIWFA